MSYAHLTQRDRVMIAEVIRRYIAADIKRRGLVDTYTPAALSVSAYDLHEFAAELLTCYDGDAVELAESVARDVADAEDLTDGDAQDIAGNLPELSVLRRLEDAHPADVKAERERCR